MDVKHIDSKNNFKPILQKQKQIYYEIIIPVVYLPSVRKEFQMTIWRFLCWTPVK